MSIREKLELAIAAIPVDSVVEKLSNGDSRIFHISALRQQAKKFEDVCQASFTPCTDVGFLEYLEKLDPDVPSTDHTDAVSILTYHKSKGLEWPVVILASLEKAPYDPNLFEITQGIVAGSIFKSTEPLANRVVRYLPWPFGGLKSIAELDAKTSGLKEIDEIRYTEQSETRRLLYVGMTRAREKLILLETLAKGGVPASMLSVLTNAGKAILSFDNQKGKIISGKDQFDCVFKTLSTVVSGDVVDQAKKISISLPQGNPLVGDVKPLYLQPSHLTQEKAPSLAVNISLGRSFEWGNKLLLKRIKDMKEEHSERADFIGSAVHLFLGSDESSGNVEERAIHAKKILERWCLTETLDVDDLIKASDRLNSKVLELWPTSKMYKEIPIELNLDGSIIRGAIDCLVVTDKEVAVIDHKTITATAKEMNEIGNKYKYQLAAYASAAKKHFSGKKVSTWIHNPDGWFCEVILNDSEASRAT
jgi:ATP-dependent exoDNAse (exonuclease V) beta subunit